MRRLFVPTLLIILVLLLTSGANAGKPSGEDNIYIGNGFPSGPHFNLNVIAKKAGFTCPEQQFLCLEGSTVSTVTDCASCSGACQPLYGGTIFVPQATGSAITILMESGAKGPKGNITATSLEVTDSCTEAFDGGPAAFRLPADPDGYVVYARVVGDPKQNPQFEFTDPALKYVMDENGNDLVLLGLVTDTKAFDSNGILLPTRYDGTQKGKGVQKGVDITSLFLWKGDVCYLEQNDLVEYCGWIANGDGSADQSGTMCQASYYCCLDEYGDGDYENCVLRSEIDSCSTDPVNLCCVDTDLELPSYEYCKPELVPGECPTSYDYFGKMLPFFSVPGVYYEPVTAGCKNYETALGGGVWVFNIADFVGLLFDIESTGPNTGSSVIQLRFYPRPLNTK